MTNTLPGNAERYTLLIRPIGKLVEVLEACAALNLQWYISTAPSSPYQAEIRIFFDKQGMENYRLGLYDET